MKKPTIPILKSVTKKERQIAILALPVLQMAFEMISNNKLDFVSIQLRDGPVLKLPNAAALLLFQIVDHMARDQSFALIPLSADLSTQEAADIMNVSRPHMVKLLESRKIPFRKAGTHRRIDLKHLIDYQKRTQCIQERKSDF